MADKPENQTAAPSGARAGIVAEEGRVMRTAEEYRAEVQAEYGTYVAIAPIDVDGARAYNPGDPVPASNVIAHDYEARDLVAKRSTRAGRDAATIE